MTKIKKRKKRFVHLLYVGHDATSIPAECCAVPYTLNGGLYYNCSVNDAVGDDVGCFHTDGQWVKCQLPAGMLFTRATLCQREY